MATKHRELLDFVSKHGVLRGRFVLSSGRESAYYIDGKMVTFSPEGLRLTIAAIRKELAPFEFDAIGGRDMGATPIAAAYAVLSPTEGRRCDAFTVRKEVKGHGSRKRIEGPLRANAKVAIVDDVVTTGASIVDAIEAVQAEGCRVVAAVTLVDRAAGAAEELARLGIPYHPLLTIADLGLSDDANRSSPLAATA